MAYVVVFEGSTIRYNEYDGDTKGTVNGRLFAMYFPVYRFGAANNLVDSDIVFNDDISEADKALLLRWFDADEHGEFEGEDDGGDGMEFFKDNDEDEV